MPLEIIPLPSNTTGVHKKIYVCDAVAERPSATNLNPGDIAIIETESDRTQMYIVIYNGEFVPNTWQGVAFANGDLSTSNPHIPQVDGLLGNVMNTPASSLQFCQYDSGTIKWISYGSAANTVMEGNDARVPQTVKLTSDLSPYSSQTLTDITCLSFSLTASTYYWFKFFILFQSSATTNGLGLRLTSTGNTPY